MTSNYKHCILLFGYWVDMSITALSEKMPILLSHVRDFSFTDNTL